jgi:hypothetical protein
MRTPETDHTCTWLEKLRRLARCNSGVSLTEFALGNQSALGARPISETEINDLFAGAELQAGTLDLANKGRMILSSVELNADGGQWLHWQRCRGAFPYTSDIGEAGDGETGTDIDSFGEGAGVAASSDNAIMMVEIAYDYEMLVPVFDVELGPITESVAFNIRDQRDLTQVYNPDSATVANCS